MDEESPWSIETIHLNVKQGDSAVHLLKQRTPDQLERVVSAVLVDGGNPEYAIDLAELLLRFQDQDYRRTNNALLTSFDALVVTHWDKDHFSGLCGLVVNAIFDSITQWLLTYDQPPLRPLPSNAEFLLAIARRDVWSTVSTYDQDGVATRFYRPSAEMWKLDAAGTIGSFNYSFANIPGANDTTDMALQVTFTWLRQVDHAVANYNGYIPFAKQGPDAGNLLCVDIFDGRRVMPPNDAKSPKNLSKKLHDLNSPPAMVCVAAEQTYSCDQANVTARGTMRWIQKDSYQAMKLVGPNAPVNDPWQLAPFGASSVNTATASAPPSIQLIPKDPTEANASSLVFMIIWPNNQTAAVSHIFAGDLDAVGEEKLLRWSAVPEDDTDPLSARIPTKPKFVKISHHGSKSSTPLLMLFVWNPYIVVCSNGTHLGHYLCSWETLFYVALWTAWRRVILNDPQGTRFLATNVPGYLCRFWAYEHAIDYFENLTPPERFKDALMEDKGRPLRDFSQAIATAINNPVLALPLVGHEQNLPAYRTGICEYLYDQWDVYCGVPKNVHRIDYDQINDTASLSQRVRLIGFMVGVGTPNSVRSAVAIGPNLRYSEVYLSSTDEYPNAQIAGEDYLTIVDDVAKTVKDKTRSNLWSLNRSRRPIGRLASKPAVELMNMDSYLITSSQSSVVEYDEGLNSLEQSTQCIDSDVETSIHTPTTHVGNTLFYFMSNDTSFVNKRETLPHGFADKDSNLDLFLGHLTSGAMILSAEPTGGDKPIELHETDELLQWLSSLTDEPQKLDSKVLVNFKSKTNQIESVCLMSKMGSIFKSLQVKLSKPLSFCTSANAHAFGLDPTAPWPAVNKEKPDVVGKPQMVVLSLGPQSDVYNLEISGQDILDLSGIKSATSLKVFADLAAFTIDNASGAKNTIWFSPDGQYTTVLRLRLLPAKSTGKTLEVLTTRLSDVIKSIVPKLAVTLSSPWIVLKKTWTRQNRPYSLKNQLVTGFGIALQHKNRSFSFTTTLVFSDDAISWILDFDGVVVKSDVAGDGMTISDILDLLWALFGLDSDKPDFASYLPGLKSITIRRVTYTKSPRDKWSVRLDIQIGIASMPFLCSAIISNQQPKFSFYAELFPENRPGQEGLGSAFDHIPYLPQNEPWASLTFRPTENAKRGVDVGRLDELFKVTEGSGNAELPESPFDVRLIQMSFQLVDQRVAFNAAIMSPAPGKKTTVPALRFAAGALSLTYDFRKRRLDQFLVAVEAVLSSPDGRSQARIGGSVAYKGDQQNTLQSSGFASANDEMLDHALIKKYDNANEQAANGAWTFTGSVANLNGGLIYSLCEDDCSEEMMQLLEHVILDVRVRYVYAGKQGKTFDIDGTLHLGALNLHCIYKHFGEQKNEKGMRWSFNADLEIEGQKSSLITVIESICDADLSKYLPDCVKNVSVAPKSGGARKLSSVAIYSMEDWICFYAQLALTDNTSIALYQIQKKRSGTKGDKIPATKRIVMFQLASIPKATGIPVVGDLTLPFSQVQFLFVSGGKAGDNREGLTEDELGILNTNKPDNFVKISFKPKETKKSGGNEGINDEQPKVVLSNGFHFIILNEEKVLLDYLFARPNKKSDEADVELVILEETVNSATPGLTPFNKKLGPVTISAVGLKFDMSTQTITVLVNGSVQLGPLELSLTGFGISLTFDKGKTLGDLSGITPSFTLSGLGLAFEKKPVVLAGYLEYTNTVDIVKFEGGATIGFDPWLFQAAGYYAQQRRGAESSLDAQNDDVFKCFMAFARLSGPIASIGYAEIREIAGGLGYNTSLRFPSMDNIMEFPFIAEPPDSPAKALQALTSKNWLKNKEGSMWVAAGLTVLAFQTLTVRAVVVVEIDHSVKLGIFGLATAEIPKQTNVKFARVQLGLAVTIDFDAGIMKVDGQLTPASFVLDPNCHLTGGFGMYTWFGASNGASQGDWVFTIGGYHSLYQRPSQYPNPPRLGISWSYDSNISITGEAYFAVTPKACMGGGRLHVTLTLGLLYAYFDAYADFLINYKPFHYQAQGGIAVGVRFTMDLYLTTIRIKVDLRAQLFIEGNPMSGKVHVDFWVFGFDINFGPAVSQPGPISGDEFWMLVLQTDTGRMSSLLASSQSMDTDGNNNNDELIESGNSPSHIFACSSGLIPQNESASTPSGDKWIVRGAIFAFAISSKFPAKTASVTTILSNDEPVKRNVDNEAGAIPMYAKPMHLLSPLQISDLGITITKVKSNDPHMLEGALDPIWDDRTAIYSILPLALWERYDPSADPSRGHSPSDMLNGQGTKTVKLMTGVSLIAPKPKSSQDKIPMFNTEEAMRLIVARGNFPIAEPEAEVWDPDPSTRDYAKVQGAWRANQTAAIDVVKFFEESDVFGWFSKADGPAPNRLEGDPDPITSAKRLVPSVPTNFVDRLDQLMTEAPVLSKG